MCGTVGWQNGQQNKQAIRQGKMVEKTIKILDGETI